MAISVKSFAKEKRKYFTIRLAAKIQRGLDVGWKYAAMKYFTIEIFYSTYWGWMLFKCDYWLFLRTEKIPYYFILLETLFPKAQEVIED